MSVQLDGVQAVDVCAVLDLEPERGVAALIGGDQVAIFRLTDGRVLAVQHLDPVSGAHVLARGIVGSRSERPTLASPVYKQVYDLLSGVCLEGQGSAPPPLRRWAVRVRDGRVLVGPELAGDVPGEAPGPPGGDGDEPEARIEW